MKYIRIFDNGTEYLVNLETVTRVKYREWTNEQNKKNINLEIYFISGGNTLYFTDKTAERVYKQIQERTK